MIKAFLFLEISFLVVGSWRISCRCRICHFECKRRSGSEYPPHRPCFTNVKHLSGGTCSGFAQTDLCFWEIKIQFYDWDDKVDLLEVAFLFAFLARAPSKVSSSQFGRTTFHDIGPWMFIIFDNACNLYELAITRIQHFYHHERSPKKVNFSTRVNKICTPETIPPNTSSFPTKTWLFRLLNKNPVDIAAAAKRRIHCKKLNGMMHSTVASR